MAKLARESRLRERRAEKQARKDARKLEPANGTEWLGEPLVDGTGEPAVAAGSPSVEPEAEALTDASGSELAARGSSR